MAMTYPKCTNNAKYALGLIFLSLLLLGAFHQPLIVKAERNLSDIDYPVPSSSPIKHDETRSCDSIKSRLDYQRCMGLTITEITTIIIVPKISAALSVAGSSYVIQDVLRNPEKRNESTYHRLMLGLSCSHIIHSLFGWFSGTWLMPKGLHLFAVGSQGSCVAIGFSFYMTILSTSLYYSSLATFYFVQLKLSWVKRKIKKIEKWLHIVPWAVGLIAAIPAFALSALGPYLNVCWLDRTSPYAVHFGIFAMAAYFCSMCYVITLMFLIYKTVRNVEREAERYSFARFSSSSRNRTMMEMSRRIMIQIVLYGFVLLYPGVIYIFNVLNIRYFVVVLLSNICFSLQGFFNALIYAIPVFQQMMKKRQKQNESQQKHLRSKQDKKDGAKVSNTNNPPREHMTGSNKQIELRWKSDREDMSPNQNEGEVKTKDSDIVASPNLLQHIDEEQVGESFEKVSHQSKVEEIEEEWKHYFTACDEDIDVFESANHDEDSDDEYYVDDYLRLMRIHQ